MNGLSEALAEAFAANRIIEQDEKELYAYGLRYTLATLLNIVTTAVIGALMGMLWQSMVFLVSYVPLRIFAGGFHAKTAGRCYIYSILMTIAALLAVKFIPWTNTACLLAMLISGLIIFHLSPVENEKKPLDEKEKIIYRRRSRQVLFVEGLVILALMCNGMLEAVVPVVVSICIQMGMVVIGR